MGPTKAQVKGGEGFWHSTGKLARALRLEPVPAKVEGLRYKLKCCVAR
jgi:hypothetical protein